MASLGSGMIFVAAVGPTTTFTVPAGQVFIGQVAGDNAGYISPFPETLSGYSKLPQGPIVIGPGYTFNGVREVIIGGSIVYNCYITGILMQNP